MATLREDGRYQERRRVGNGKRLAGYGDTPEAAMADLEQKVAEWRKAQSTPSTAEDPGVADGEHTVHTWAKAAWYPRIRHLAPLTQAAYEATYRSHVRPYLGHLPLSAIRLPNTQAWINELASSGKRDRKGERTMEPLGSKKVGEARHRLTSIMDLAVADRQIESHPVRSTTVPKKVPKRVRVMTLAKALEISDATRGTRMHAPVVLAMVLGLRRGEIAGLRWDDLDRQGLRLTVYEQITTPKGGSRRSRVKTDAGMRVLPLTKELVEIIDGCGNLDHDAGYIAGWHDGRWRHPDKITHDWDEIRGGFGMDDWTFHDLRHGAASILRTLKVDLLVIARILGHSKIDTTLIYADAMEEEVGRALADVAKAFAKR